MTKHAWVGCLVVAMAACRGEAKPPAPAPAPAPLPCVSETRKVERPVQHSFMTTSVPCFVPAGAPHFEGDTRGLTYDARGPDYCQRVLELFLQQNPWRHIVAVLPIEYPIAAAPVGAPSQDEGTQELLVIHTDGGRWPVASHLAILPSSCGVGRMWSVGPAFCKAALDEHSMLAEDTEFWIPLNNHTKSKIHEPGTGRILRISRKLNTK